MDKRIVRTRLAIFNAVFDLATEKELDKITVVELCDRAGINKSTFYLHYSSINDCFQKCFDYFMGRLLEFGRDLDYSEVANAPEELVKRLLDAVEENTKYLVRFRNSVVYDSVVKTLKESFVDEICKNNNIDIENNYHQVAKLTFLVGGCTDIIMKLTPNFNRPEIEKIMVDVIKRK